MAGSRTSGKISRRRRGGRKNDTMIKKLTAGLLAAAMTVGLSGCTLGTTSWILRYGEDNAEVPTGIYVQNMYTAYQAATQYVEDSSNVLDGEIDGRSADQWIRDTALNLTKQYLAVNLKFDEEGLTLTEAENTNIQTLVDTVWNLYGESYTLLGINRDSYQKMQEYSAKASDLFQHYYGEGGELAPTDEEYSTYFTENYDRTRAVYYAKNDVDSMTDEERAEAEAALAEGETLPESGREQADAALSRIQNGEDIVTILQEIEAEQAAESGSTDETADNSSSSATDDAADDTGSDSAADTETDPSQYDNLVNVNNTSVPEAYRTASHEMAVGESRIVETDSGYYVVYKLELDPDGSELESRKASLLQEMKGDEYNDMIAQWVEELPEVTVNEATVEEFSPELIDSRSN